MNRFAIISAAIGMAFAMQASAQAQGMAPSSSMGGGMKGTMSKSGKEKCYGINAVGKNDCHTASVAGPGKSMKARDPGAFVAVPAGVCAKIDGGSMNAM